MYVNGFCSRSFTCAVQVVPARTALCTAGTGTWCAGVGTVSRYVKGNAEGLPDIENPVFAEAQARTEKFASGGQIWVDPRAEGWLPDAYIAVADRNPGCHRDQSAQARGRAVGPRPLHHRKFRRNVQRGTT